MQSNEGTKRPWQISLKALFGFMTLVAIEIWQLQYVVFPVIFAILAAVVLEEYGHRKAANCVVAAQACVMIFAFIGFVFLLAAGNR